VHPRDDRGDLAQPQDQRPGHPIPDRVRPLITVGKQRLESLVRGDGLLEAVRRGPVQDQQVDLLDGEFAEDAAPPGEAVAPTAVVNAFRVGCGCSGR